MEEGRRRLHNEELHNFYTSPNTIGVIKSRRMRLTGNVECMGEMRNADKILVRKLEGKRPFGRLGQKWEDNIRMDPRDRGHWWAVVNTPMNFHIL
jgi:hypothetical protein